MRLERLSLLLAASFLLASCGSEPGAAAAVRSPVSEITMPDLREDHDQNASICTALGGGIRMTIRRIEPCGAEDGKIEPGPLLGFEERYYRVLGPEREVSASASKTLCTDVVAALRHSGESTLFCGFSPGLFVRLHRLAGGQDFLIGMGAICLQCGEWHLMLRSADGEFGLLRAALGQGAYDDILAAAVATFPDDGSLKGIRKKGSAPASAR